VDKAPPVRVFVMGADRWRDAADWPIPGAQFTSYYLRSLGEANSSGGNGRINTDKPAADEPADRYVYDPANPYRAAAGIRAALPMSRLLVQPIRRMSCGEAGLGCVAGRARIGEGLLL
jgi:putative CocE/NonD family hydrolase